MSRLTLTGLGSLLTAVALLAPLASQAQLPTTPEDRFGNQQREREREAMFRRNPNSLTLEQAVNRALDHNLDIQRAENSLRISQEDVRAGYLSYLPDLNASISLNRRLGTTVDPVLQLRVPQNFNSSSPNVFLSLPLFQGFAQLYTLQQARVSRSANEQALIRQRNTVLQNTVLQYLQVIFDQSNIDISRTRIDLLRNQLARQQALFQAGAAVRFDVLNVQSQLAVEEQTLITAINTLRADKIRLLQTLQLQPLDSLDGGYDIVPIDTAFLARQLGTANLPSIGEVEEAAYQNMPDLKESQFRIDAARYGQKLAFGQFLPTLTFNASWSSSFLSVARNPFTGGEINYFQQLNENETGFLGFSLNIPLFNSWQVQRNYRVSRIQRENAQLDLETRKNQLTLQVRQAYLDVIAAREQQESLARQAEALREAFVAAEAQFNAGLIDFTQYLDALNNRSRIEQQQIQNLYNYYLRSKIVDLFMGRPLQF